VIFRIQITQREAPDEEADAVIAGGGIGG